MQATLIAMQLQQLHCNIFNNLLQKPVRCTQNQPLQQARIHLTDQIEKLERKQEVTPETRGSFLSQFRIRRHYRTPSQEGKPFIPAEATEMLRYALDNLQLDDAQMVRHFQDRYTNPHKRMDQIMLDLDRGRRGNLSEQEFEYYLAALQESRSIFRDGAKPSYHNGANLGLTKEEYLAEGVKYLRCFAETFMCLYAPEELMVGSPKKVLAESALPKYTQTELELLEAMRLQGLLQCDLDR